MWSSIERMSRLIDDVMDFLRGGLEALKHNRRAAAASDAGDTGPIE